MATSKISNMIKLRVSSNFKNQVESFASSRDLSVSALTRIALYEYIEAHHRELVEWVAEIVSKATGQRYRIDSIQAANLDDAKAIAARHAGPEDRVLCVLRKDETV